MEERLRFVARILAGEGMSEVCREFGISRKTGYKTLNRYKQDGLEALGDRSRRPVRYANQLRQQIERFIVETRREKPQRGARKLARRILNDASLEDLTTRTRSALGRFRTDRQGDVAKHAR